MRNIKDICLSEEEEIMVNVDTKNPEDWNIEAYTFFNNEDIKFFRKDEKDIEDDMNEEGFVYGEHFDINFYAKYYPETDDAKLIVCFEDFTDGSAEKKFNELCDNLKWTKDTNEYTAEIILTDDEKAELKGMLLDFFEQDKKVYEIYNEAKEDMKKEAKTQDVSKE